MDIRIYHPADPMVLGRQPLSEPIPLEDLLAEDDGLREDETQIRATLDRGETYEAGGGAAPSFCIVPA